MPAKTRIYIDGFNLYYGAVKDTPYRWLDVRRMCELLLPEYSIETIKYFTARVSARNCAYRTQSACRHTKPT